MSGVKVILFLMPSRYDIGKGRSAYQIYVEKKELLNHKAPWLKVEAPFMEVF
jgi:hypothetical protein